MSDGSRSQRDIVRPPLFRTPPGLPRGPRQYHVPRDRGYIGGAGEPPPGFVGMGTSSYEWMIYHAISKVLGEPEDPRTPPFIGEPGMWVFQKAWDGGRDHAGGAIVDFIVYAGNKTVVDTAFRIQTEYFHIFSDAETQARDLLQRWQLSESMRLVDLYDHEFAFDMTNQAAVILVKRALAGEVFEDPITAGTAQRVRPGRAQRG